MTSLCAIEGARRVGVAKGPVAGRAKVCIRGHAFTAGLGCSRCKTVRQDEKRKRMRAELAAQRAPKELPPPALTPDQPKYALTSEQLAEERRAASERRAIRLDEAIERAKRHPEYVAKWVAKVKARKQ